MLRQKFVSKITNGEFFITSGFRNAIQFICCLWEKQRAIEMHFHFGNFEYHCITYLMGSAKSAVWWSSRINKEKGDNLSFTAGYSVYYSPLRLQFQKWSFVFKFMWRKQLHYTCLPHKTSMYWWNSWLHLVRIYY